MPASAALRKPKPGDARLPSKPSKDLPSCSPAASRLLFDVSPVELIEITAKVLQQTVDANGALLGGTKQARSEVTRFHTRDPPAISVKAYLTRLLQLAPFPFDALLLAVVYINRLTHLQLARSPQTALKPLFPQQHTVAHSNAPQQDVSLQSSNKCPPPSLTPWTVHRLLLGALAIAAKYTSDAYIGQRRLAKVGGINIRELFELEIEVFNQLSWSCYTTQTELGSVCSLMWQSATQQSQKCEETGAGSQTPDARLPLGSPDSLKIGMLVISPGRDNQPDLSPTPAMSDAGSESSGVASSLDDVRNPIANETLPSKLNPQKLAFGTPSLSPIPLR